MALNLAARSMLHNYNRVNGMANTAWISGYLRGVTPNKRAIFVQQTNNENQFLPILLPDDYKMPEGFKEFSPISTVCHIGGRDYGNGSQMAIAKAIGIFEPNVLEMDIRSGVRNAAYGSGMEDQVEMFLRGEIPAGLKGDHGDVADMAANVSVMPPDSAFQHSVPEGAPESKFKPFTGRDDRLADASNVVRLAGFVHDIMLERVDIENGVNGKLEILLRQQSNPDACIPIWYYGKLAEVVAEKLEFGLPIMIVGKYRIHVRKMGGQDEAGMDLIDKRPYIHCDGPPMVPKIHPREGAITHIPDWAWMLRQKSKAIKRRGQGDGAALPVISSPEELAAAEAGVGVATGGVTVVDDF